MSKDQEHLMNLRKELTRISGLSMSALRQEHARLFDGETSRSKSREHLVRKLAWRTQELAEGGLTKRAERRALELGKTAPVHRTSRGYQGLPLPEAQPLRRAPEAPINSSADERLPPAGALLHKEYKGTTHVVRVLASGFEYCGQHFASLSKIASLICGGNRNGFRFFECELKAAKGKP